MLPVLGLGLSRGTQYCNTHRLVVVFVLADVQGLFNPAMQSDILEHSCTKRDAICAYDQAAASWRALVMK